MVGPKESYAKNVVTTTYTINENFIASDLPWPSDHKAVFATITFPFSTVSVQEERLESLFFYPNPANGKIRIETKEAIQQVWLIDMKGTMQPLMNVNDVYDISYFPKGCYVLKIVGATQVNTSKLIID